MNDKFEISTCYRKVFELLNKVSGVQELINKIMEFTGAVIAVTDISGKIVAVSDENTRDKSKQFEKIVMDLYEQKNYSNRQSFRIEEQDIHLSVGNFSIKGNEEGFVFVFAETEDVACQVNDIVRQAVEIVAERMGKKIHSHASTQRRILAKMLFENQKLSKDQIEEGHLTGPFLAAVFKCEEEQPEISQKFENGILDSWINSFAYRDQGLLYVLFADIYCKEAEEALHKKIEILCDENNYYCVMGEKFDTVDLLQQKKILLSETVMLAPSGKRFNKEYDFYLEMVCTSAVNKIGSARYMEEKLQKLREDDFVKGTEFYRSLKEYLLLRNNVSMTAKRLFIHRNTMIYRLSRVTEFLEVDINDPIIANNLMISMLLQEIERRNS